MSTDTDVYAQRTQLITEQVNNPVTLSVIADATGTLEFSDALFEQFLPASISRKARAIFKKFQENDPDYHPDSLPVITLFDDPGQTEEGYPLLWLRNKNIDLDSVWWNLHNETDIPYSNHRPTDLNDTYWHVDLDDPDIDRIPEDPPTLLSSRDFVAIDEHVGVLAVPYEIVYPEWFKAHPEYVKTDAILQDLGIDLKVDILQPIRETENFRKIDNVLVGFFMGMLPQSRAQSEYLYQFFRHIFKNKAFQSALVKQTSPCVEYALSVDGLYSKTGEVKGFIYPGGTTLQNKKSQNYYYEYKASEDVSIDLNKIFRLDDSKTDMSLELSAEEVLIRKVRGSIVSTAGASIEVVIGKGVPYPELIHFKGMVYPEDPTIASVNDPADVEAYDTNVIQPHVDAFVLDTGGLVDIYPVAWIAIRKQKFAKTSHAWDTESNTTLNNPKDIPYYEEIIIINPRVEYRSVYGEAHTTQRAYNAFYPGDAYETVDSPNIFTWNNGTEAFEETDIGTAFSEDEGDSESVSALVVPIMESPLHRLRLKELDEVVSSSLSTITISVERSHSNWLNEHLLDAIVLAITVYSIFTGTQALVTNALNALAEDRFVSWIMKTVILTKVIQIAAQETVDILVDTLGLDDAGKFIAALEVAFTVYLIKNPSLSINSTHALQYAANFSSSYAKVVKDAISDNYAMYEENAKENYRTLEELQKDYEDLLPGVDTQIYMRLLTFDISEESPTEFFNRVIGNKNPGVALLGVQEVLYDAYKTVGIKSNLPLISDSDSVDDPIDYLI